MNRFFRLRHVVSAAALASLAIHPVLWAQTVQPLEPKATVPANAKAKTIPLLTIPGGRLPTAIDEISHALRSLNLPEMNVIVAPEAREIQTPELLLRNVSGPDALRLLAVSVGCDVEDINGADDLIGYRIFAVHDLPDRAPAIGGGMPGLGSQEHAGTPTAGYGIEGGMPRPPQPVPPSPISGSGPVRVLPGTPNMSPGPANPFGNYHQSGVTAFPGMMQGGSGADVHVYGLGGITNHTKFADIEETLRDVLKAGSISADAAKLAFHERTNVLVVTAQPGVHAIVSQFLDALQKNAAVAADEQKRSASARHEVAEAMIRLRMEEDQRKRLATQLDEAEVRLREAQREIDRLKAAPQKVN